MRDDVSQATQESASTDAPIPISPHPRYGPRRAEPRHYSPQEPRRASLAPVPMASPVLQASSESTRLAVGVTTPQPALASALGQQQLEMAAFARPVAPVIRVAELACRSLIPRPLTGCLRSRLPP